MAPFLVVAHFPVSHLNRDIACALELVKCIWYLNLIYIPGDFFLFSSYVIELYIRTKTKCNNKLWREPTIT